MLGSWTSWGQVNNNVSSPLTLCVPFACAASGKCDRHYVIYSHVCLTPSTVPKNSRSIDESTVSMHELNLLSPNIRYFQAA
jgi:hypothetical protein